MFHRNYIPVFTRSKEEFHDFITELLDKSSDGNVIHENQAPYNCYAGKECGPVQ